MPGNGGIARVVDAERMLDGPAQWVSERDQRTSFTTYDGGDPEIAVRRPDRARRLAKQQLERSGVVPRIQTLGNVGLRGASAIGMRPKAQSRSSPRQSSMEIDASRMA